MKRIMKKVKYLLVPIIVVTTFSAANSQILTYTERSALGPLNPYNYSEPRAVAERLFSMIYEPLFVYDHNSEEYRPQLARNIREMGSNRVRVELREDVYWHDGERFTASDVVFTYRYIMEESPNQTLSRFFDSAIENIEASANFIVEIEFADDVSSYEGYLDTWIIPSHRFNSETLQPVSAREDIARSPVGTGKYIYENRSGNELVLRVNDRYYLSDPGIREVRYTRVVDMDVALTRLLAETSDLMIEVLPERLTDIEDGALHRLEPYQSYSFTGIGFNFENEHLQNQRVRSAITHATDRAGMLDSWFAGRGEVLAGPLSHAAHYYNPDLPPLEYDQTLARNLLNNAGYRDLNGDGYLQDENGNRLELRLLQQVVDDGGSAAMQNVSRDFQEMMQEIGIRIQVDNRSDDDYRAAYRNGEFDLLLLTFFFNTDYSIEPLFRTDRSSNFVSYSNSEVDDLFDRFNRSTDVTQRQIIMNRIQSIIAQDLPYMFMFSVDRHAAIHSRFVNVMIDPFYFFTDIDRWQVVEF